MYLSERLNRKPSHLSIQASLLFRAQDRVGTSPGRITAILRLSWVYIVNIIISHYKEDLRATRQISRSLSETGFSGFFNQTFPASFCEPLIVVVGIIIYRTTIALPVFLPFHRWLGCLKNINIRNVSKHVITHI